MQPSFAVCLAAHNGTKWLDAQLDSILAQVGVAVKIFVSVDRSTDDTVGLVDRRAARDSRIVRLPYGAHFGGAAPNFFHLLRTVDTSGFDYLSLSDQDDIWLTGKLLRAHEELQRTEADAYSSNVVAFWPSGARKLSVKSQPQVRWDFLFEAAGAGCTYVMRQSLASSLQKLLRMESIDLRPIRHHDWFVYAYARANGYRWHIDPRAELLYRQHEENEVGVNMGLRPLMERARRVLNERALAQAVITARACGLGDDPFVRRWSDGSRSGLVWLALHARDCRRRPRDQALFAAACLALCATGRQA